MHRVLRLRPSPGSAVAALALLLASGGAAWASANSSGNSVIHACAGAAKHSVRTLTLPAHGSKCPKGDSSIAWNQHGQQGATGEPGLNGAQGLTGAEGKEGKEGKPGKEGVLGYKVVTAVAQAGVPAGETKIVTAKAVCASGKVLLGGGGDASNGSITTSGPVIASGTPKNEWESAVSFDNTTAGEVTVTVTAVAYCATE